MSENSHNQAIKIDSLSLAIYGKRYAYKDHLTNLVSILTDEPIQ
jgi:hypothetical protein